MRLFSLRRTRRTGSNAHEPEEPIRSELFSVERLKEHAASLATAQRIAFGRSRGQPLQARLLDNGRVLLGAYRYDRRRDPRGARDHPGSRVARRQLPRRRGADSRDSRRSAARLLSPASQARRRAVGGPSARLRHWPGPSSRTPTAASIRRRCAASCRPTSACSRSPSASSGRSRSRCASCWSRTSVARPTRIVSDARRAATADALADRAARGWGTDAERSAASPRLDKRRADRLRGATGAAAARPGSRRSRRRSPGWIERLAAQGTTADEIVREEHRRQGAMNVTVRNVITSMRLMSDVDWTEFFESVSLVDERLRAGQRLRGDGFRDAATAIAMRSKSSHVARTHTELEVVGRAISAAGCGGTRGATAGLTTHPPQRRSRVPSHRPGTPAFEGTLGFRPSLWRLAPAALPCDRGSRGYLGDARDRHGAHCASTCSLARPGGVRRRRWHAAGSARCSR